MSDVLLDAISERVYDVPANLPMRGRWVSNWFSNMTLLPTPIRLGDIEFNSVEQLYKAGSIRNLALRRDLARMTPQQAKAACNMKGSAFWDDRRPDWAENRLPAMWNGLRQAWVGERLEALRKAAAPIVEFNNWGDQFFGFDTVHKKGRNVLGRMLGLIVEGRGPDVVEEHLWPSQTPVLIQAIETMHLDYKIALPAPAQGALF